MKENVTMWHAAAMHLRAVRELHQVTPSFFPVLTLYCIFDAMLPYVTVFFSARILTELAVLRRAEILWQWDFAFALIGHTPIILCNHQRQTTGSNANGSLVL